LCIERAGFLIEPARCDEQIAQLLVAAQRAIVAGLRCPPCYCGDDGKVVLETAVATKPALIGKTLERYVGRLHRVGH